MTTGEEFYEDIDRIDQLKYHKTTDKWFEYREDLPKGIADKLYEEFSYKYSFDDTSKLRQLCMFIDIFNHEYDTEEYLKHDYEFYMSDKSWKLLESLVDEYSKEINESTLLYIKAILSERNS